MNSTNVILDNANKLAFLISKFPDKTVTKVLNMLQMPPVQSNAGIWYAQELGWLGEAANDVIPFIKAPDDWHFGDIVDNLIDQIKYCFNHMAKDEMDIDETFLTDWLTGYASQDVLVVMHYLLDTKVLAEYQLTDHNEKLGDSTYTFYTLAENVDKQWGKKNFRDETVVDDDDTPEEDKHLGEA